MMRFACLIMAAALAASAAPLPLAELARVTPERYPDANAVIVFDSTFVALAANGRSVERMHLLVKILTEQGKKQYARTWDSYCLTYSTARLKLARVITPAGKVIPVPKKDIVDIPAPVGEGEKFILPNVRVVSAQFPSLEIGAAVEWIVEYASTNPVMENNYDEEVGFETTEPIVYKQYSITTPAAMKLNWAVSNGAVDTSFTVAGRNKTWTWSRRDVGRVVYEPYMPWGDAVCKLLLTTVPDWQTWSSWYHRLCEPQYALDSALAAKTDELVRGAASEAETVRALYYFVGSHIRYVETSYSGRKAGYVPEKVSLTYAKRYGVCRDKAALLVAMLRHAGISADIVLTNPGIRMEKFPPVDRFNHAIVAVKRPDGSYYYLDPTTENVRDLLMPTEMGRPVLVATDPGSDLAWTPYLPADSSVAMVRIDDTLAADGTLSGTVTVTPSGVEDVIMRSQRSYLAAPEWRANLERTIRVFGPNTSLDTVTITDYRDLGNPMRMSLHFTSRDFATVQKRTIRFTLPKSGTGTFAGSGLSWAASLPERRYPLDFNTARMWRLSHNMTLPRGYKVKLMPDSLSLDFGRCAVSSTTAATGNLLTNEVTLRLNDPRLPLAEYPNLRRLLAAGEDIERQHVMLKPAE